MDAWYQAASRLLGAHRRYIPRQLPSRVDAQRSVRLVCSLSRLSRLPASIAPSHQFESSRWVSSRLECEQASPLGSRLVLREYKNFCLIYRVRLGKVCTTLVATSADARVFRWRQLRCDLGHSRADSRPVVDPFGRCGRTHPRAPCKSVRRTIHRLESANSVCSCAVFLAKPR